MSPTLGRAYRGLFNSVLGLRWACPRNRLLAVGAENGTPALITLNPISALAPGPEPPWGFCRIPAGGRPQGFPAGWETRSR